MNEILEALEEDRFAIHCPKTGPDGPWTLQQVAQILGNARRLGWCLDEHHIELIEVTN